MRRCQFIFKDQSGDEVFEVTPTHWKQLKGGEICEVSTNRRSRDRQEKQTSNPSVDLTNNQGRPMEAKVTPVTPDQVEDIQPGPKDVTQKQTGYDYDGSSETSEIQD